MFVRKIKGIPYLYSTYRVGNEVKTVYHGNFYKFFEDVEKTYKELKNMKKKIENDKAKKDKRN